MSVVFWSQESAYKVLAGGIEIGTVRIVIYDDASAFTSVVASCKCDFTQRVAPSAIRGMADAEAWLRRHAKACPSFAPADACPTMDESVRAHDAAWQVPGFRGELADVVDP